MSDNTIEIEINGENYSNFISGTVSRRFDEFCGTFDFKCSKDDVDDFNINAQSECVIYVNGKKAITGVIDKVSPSEDATSSEVDISGRDRTCDIVDSSIPSSIALSGNFNLVTVIEKVLKILELDDIKVINEISDLKDFTTADIISSEVDKNAFEFINDYAQKVSAILITDEDGNIRITRAGTNRVPDKLVNVIGTAEQTKDNNLLSSSAGYDFSQRYNKYVVVSQGNTTTQQGNVSADTVSQKGIAYDNEVRKSRVLVIKSNNACDNKTCQDIATLECNVRRANSLKYNCEVAGFTFNSGELYSINTLITVIDDDNFISSELLVKSVDFNFGDGSTTSLELAVADAYTLQANLDEIESRTNKTDNKTKSTKTTKSKTSSTKKDSTPTLTAEQQAELNKALGK